MNKIILAQIDTIAGNIKYNSEKIKNAIIDAKSEEAQLIIFPKLALFGNNYGDIADRHKSLFKYQQEELEKIVQLSNNITIILGYLGENCENKIAIAQNGQILSTDRIFKLNEKEYIVTDTFDFQAYELQNKEAIIILASDASRCGKEAEKDSLLKSTALLSKTNVIYVNQVGYANDYVMEGGSRIYNANAKLTLQGKFFKEELIEAIDYLGSLEEKPTNMEKQSIEEFSLNYENDLARTYQEVICGIKGYFYKNGFKKAVLGLSGGLDSTVCATLLVDALGKENVLGISMPTKITSTGSKQDANILAQNLGIEFWEVPIANEIDIFTKELNELFKTIKAEQYVKSTTFENIQARTRATILWSIANECKGMLPIATSDKSELYIGYATINGDMSGGFAPIADITKTKLFALADYLNKNHSQKNAIPQSILEKPPGAELKFDETKGRTINAEEDNMPYPFLDEIIWHVENKNYGFEELINHTFDYETENNISKEQKEEWILKFFDKVSKAIFKWHLLPPSVIIDTQTINQKEYNHPIISKFYNK